MRQFVIDWVADLRANPDIQGKTHLNANDRFCCLGRLCELKNIPKSISNSSYNFTVYSYGNSFDTMVSGLPSEVTDKVKISTYGAFVPSLLSFEGQKFHRDLSDKMNYDFNTLADANDSGISFDEIATLIEYIEQSDAWSY